MMKPCPNDFGSRVRRTGDTATRVAQGDEARGKLERICDQLMGSFATQSAIGAAAKKRHRHALSPGIGIDVGPLKFLHFPTEFAEPSADGFPSADE